MSMWGWPQWIAATMSAFSVLAWGGLMFGRRDVDYGIALLWAMFWVWVLWMGGFWS